MKDLIRILGTAAILGASALISVSAQDPPSEGTTAGSLRTLEALLEKLGSDAPEVREAALAEILKIGGQAVPFLKEALSKTQDAETRARLEVLLSELIMPDPSTFFAGRRPGGTGKAVTAALQWLARHQNPDGSWSSDRLRNQCSATKCAGTGELDYDVGVTALATLAFLGAGTSIYSRDEVPDPAGKNRVLKVGEVVRSAIKWLIAHQDQEGCVGERGMKYGYNHAISTLALAEAFGMLRSEFLKAPAQKAVNFLVAAQNPGKGWRYSSKCGDNDSSVTIWAVTALEVAQISGLKVPKEASEGALAWFDEVTEQNGYYQVGYNARSTGKVFVPGQNDQFEHHATMSAAGITARILIQRRTTAPELVSSNLLVYDLPTWKANSIDFYYWHYGSLALFQLDGPDGPMWKLWNTAMVEALVPNQKVGTDGCAAGSWDSSVDRWGITAGRVYATAMNALTLETASRYPAFSGFKKRPRR